MRTFPIFWEHCAPKLSTPPRRIPSFVGAVLFLCAKLSAWARGERVVCRFVWSVVSLSRVSFAERRAFGEERARLCARCSWVSASMLLGVRRGAPLEVHPFEKVGLLRRSGSVKCPLSCAHPTGARRSHDRFFATFHSFIPLLLLSGKLQNGRKIHPEALWYRTSGFLFQKADPPNQIMMVGFAARGRTRNEWACPKRVVQRKRVPLFLWKKNRPLLLLLSVQTPRGTYCCSANVSRLRGRASLGHVSIGRDKAKSRWVQ